MVLLGLCVTAASGSGVLSLPVVSSGDDVSVSEKKGSPEREWG